MNLEKIISIKVPQEKRSSFLQKNFGIDLMSIAENMIFDFMKIIVKDYNGGFYDFYQLSNGGFYIATDDLSVNIKINNIEEQISGEAAGIIATVFTLEKLLFEDSLDLFFKLGENNICKDYDFLQEKYLKLFQYAEEHKEWNKMKKVID